ncbi:MAG TPA: DUF4919 domain-containing protein [Terracidiphilus sp.]|nr:DUF4919 domain-containing protein [Terracidiphilus sp.]
MRNILVVLGLLAVVALPPAVAAQDQPSEYATLLASLKAGKTDIDYTRLRLSYMDSPEYKAAKDVSKSEDAMTEALNKNDYPAALKHAEAVLESNYVNIDAHYVALVANREMGAMDKAEFHRTVFRGLINSIRSSGDGKSMETAWVVITVHEEYVVLRVLGFRPSGQSLVNQNGHAYDVMKVKRVEDGTEQTFYFNVDIPFKHYGF